MVDWAKKIQKHCADALYAGESIAAGTVVQPGGTLGRQVAFGVGGLVGAIAADKLGKGVPDEPADGGHATAFPATQSVLGISEHRLMVFAHGSLSGKPKELIHFVPLHDVAKMKIEKNKMSYTIGIGFGDGSGVSYEAVKLAKPEEFVATFERLRG